MSNTSTSGVYKTKILIADVQKERKKYPHPKSTRKKFQGWKKVKNYKLQKFTATYLSEYCGTELKNKRTFFFNVPGSQMYNIQEDH